MANEKFYGMKNDYMFKMVLQSSDDVLRNLISVLMGIEESQITSCEIKNAIELGQNVDSKDCVLDVKLELNHSEIIDLECQVRDEHNWQNRSLLCWARAYDSLEEGEDYSKLKKTYHIGILDFTLFKDNPSFYAEYIIKDNKTGYVYSDKLNIRILDLSKVDIAEKSGTENKQMIKWARIFKVKTLAELEELAGEEEVFMTMVSQVKN